MENLVTQIGLPLIAVLVPLVIAGFKKLAPSIPSFMLPIVAALLGPLFDLAIGALTGLGSKGALAGALAGLAGVGLREIKDQAQKVIAGPA